MLQGSARDEAVAAVARVDREALNCHARWPVGVPVAALATAHVALTDLLDTLANAGPGEAWTAEDVSILGAVEEIVAAAHERFVALRVGRCDDVVALTVRLRAAGTRLRNVHGLVDDAAA